MASIQKRGKKYAVIYTYEDSTQTKRQKWESFTTKKEALARKAQVENEINNGTFIPPSNVTVTEFLKDFVELYGSKRWGLSAYSGNTGLIDNYINPILGEYNIQDINRRGCGPLYSGTPENGASQYAIPQGPDRDLATLYD